MPVADTDIDNFDHVMNINAKGMMLCLRAETAAMRKQESRTYAGRTGNRDIGRGVIVNCASANSFAGLPGKMSYTVSKHAVMALTKMTGKFTKCLSLWHLEEQHHLYVYRCLTDIYLRT